MNKFIDPRFWDHPTPMNLFLLAVVMSLGMAAIIVGGAALVYTMFGALKWVSTWPWHLVVNSR